MEEIKYLTDKYTGSWKSWNIAVRSSMSSFFFIFSNIFAMNNSYLSQEDRIRTSHVHHKPHKVCLISSIQLPRSQVPQHRRVISTYIRYLWLNTPFVQHLIVSGIRGPQFLILLSVARFPWQDYIWIGLLRRANLGYMWYCGSFHDRLLVNPDSMRHFGWDQGV